MLGKVGNHMVKIILVPYHIPHTRIKSKWMKDFNIKNEAIQLLEENIGEFLYNLDTKIKLSMV